MLRKRIIPCLLIKDERLVKTVKFKNPIYIGDPINAIKIFNDKETDELVFIDINAKKSQGPNFELINKITSECFMPIAYGGGITNLQQIQKLFQIGVEKVILGKSIFNETELIKEAVKQFGSQSITAIIDIKKPLFSSKKSVYTNDGTLNTKKNPLEFCQYLEQLGVGEIILQSIDREGTRLGYDIELIELISKKTNIPIVALGGANNTTDFQKAFTAGASAVGAGTFFTLKPPHNAVLISYLEETDFKLFT